MKIGLSFAAGVLAFLMAGGLISCFIFGRNIDSILTVVPGFSLYALVAWIFFSIGARVFGKSNSVVLAFALGALCGLAQIAIGEAAIPYIGSVHAMLAFFFLPLAVCSFFAPTISRRNG